MSVICNVRNQDFDLERCGNGTELNFIELARQCERHEEKLRKQEQREEANHRFAERYYACAGGISSVVARAIWF